MTKGKSRFFKLKFKQCVKIITLMKNKLKKKTNKYLLEAFRLNEPTGLRKSLSISSTFSWSSIFGSFFWLFRNISQNMVETSKIEIIWAWFYINTRSEVEKMILSKVWHFSHKTSSLSFRFYTFYTFQTL